MFTQAELIDAINELEGGKHSIQNCEKMAAIYTVLDHITPEVPQVPYSRGYSNAVEADVVGHYGNTDFLEAIAGKPARDVWLLVDELVEAISVLNPRLFDNFFDKLNTVRPS